MFNFSLFSLGNRYITVCELELTNRDGALLRIEYTGGVLYFDVMYTNMW